MIWDIYYTQYYDMRWRSLYQTNVSNSNDGDLFVRDKPWGGIGIGGNYHGAIVPDTWNRIAVTIDSSHVMRKYVNGLYVGQQTAMEGTNPNRWILDPTFEIFADENGDTAPGYVSSYRFADRAMSTQEIRGLGGVNAQGTGTPGQVDTRDASAFTPGAFTVAILGDSQNYEDSLTTSGIFNNATQWLVNNKDSRNIKFVMHTGDFVNDNANSTLWTRAMSAMNTLNGKIPFAVVPGNHDYSDNRNSSLFNSSLRFGANSPYAKQSTLDGYYADSSNPTSRMNTYHTFEANGNKYLVLALEFGPRDAVVDWAKGIVDSHSDYKTILLTHAYMTDGGARFDRSVDPSDPYGRTYDELRAIEVGHDESMYNPHDYAWAGSNCNDGQELWDKIVKGSDNMPLVISGHQYEDFDGFPYLMTTADDGDPVYQLLVDPQGRASGGEGWIRLLEFQPDGKTVIVKTYSPYFGEWSYATDEYFTLTLPVPEPSTVCLLASLFASIGVAAGIVRRRMNQTIE
jgi:3',5'-cyclic AMP phosphodiesterase CpdA